MTKIKVTLEENKALNEFLIHRKLEEAIEDYLEFSFTWCDCYLPLKNMGFEKFCKCLIYGYEIEIELPPIPKLSNAKIRVCLNNDIKCIKEGEEIFINTKGIKSFSIKEAEVVADTIYNLIEYYKKYSS